MVQICHSGGLDFVLVKLDVSLFLCPNTYNAFLHGGYHCTTWRPVAEGLLCYNDHEKMCFVHCLRVVGYCKI